MMRPMTHLHPSHHNHTRHCRVSDGSGGEIRKNPFPKGRVHDVFVDQLRHLPSHRPEVHRVSVADCLHRQFLLPFVANKLLPQLLRVTIHEEIKLDQDCEPNVVRTDDKGCDRSNIQLRCSQIHCDVEWYSRGTHCDQETTERSPYIIEIGLYKHAGEFRVLILPLVAGDRLMRGVWQAERITAFSQNPKLSGAG